MSLFISHYRLLLGSPLSSSRTFQMSLFFEVHCQNHLLYLQCGSLFQSRSRREAAMKTFFQCWMTWSYTGCEGRSPLTPVTLLFYSGYFSSHGTSTRSEMAHAGTGSGVLNGMAWHTFHLVLSVLKGNLENLPGPVCSQCRWDNCHVSAYLIRNRSACVCVHVWLMHIIYGKRLFSGLS